MKRDFDDLSDRNRSFAAMAGFVRSGTVDRRVDPVVAFRSE